MSSLTKQNHFSLLLTLRKKNPLVYTLEQAANKNVFFDIGGQKNFQQFSQTNKRFEIIPKTIIEDRYKRAFEQVQEHIIKGDSYLLNLTFPSEVFFKGTLKELFLASKSPYKLFFKNQFVSYSSRMFCKDYGR